jgi:hypothetical protein
MINYKLGETRVLQGMNVELGDDVTYHMRGFGSISFQVPSFDVLKLDYVCFVLGLKKNHLSVT